MDELLAPLLRIALMIFVAGSLFEMGLRVPLRDAREALEDWRFTIYSAILGFAVGPLVAVLLAWILPLTTPHAIGLVLLALAPGAPFLGNIAARARGDFAHAEAFVIISTVGTALLMPLAVPVLTGAFADAWAIEKPLLFYIIAPLLAGTALQVSRPALAIRLHPVVHRAVNVAVLLAIVLIALLFTREFVGAVGTYAIAAQVLFLAIMTAAGYVLSGGLPEAHRRVVALGLCSRNVGAAAAPLLSTGADQRAMVMVALAIPTTVIGAALATRWFVRHDVRTFA